MQRAHTEKMDEQSEREQTQERQQLASGQHELSLRKHVETAEVKAEERVKTIVHEVRVAVPSVEIQGEFFSRQTDPSGWNSNLRKPSRFQGSRLKGTD